MARAREDRRRLRRVAGRADERLGGGLTIRHRRATIPRYDVPSPARVNACVESRAFKYSSAACRRPAAPARRGRARRSEQRRPAAFQNRPPPTPARQQRPSRCRPPDSPTTRPRRSRLRRLAPARLTCTVRCLPPSSRHFPPFHRSPPGTRSERNGHRPHSAPSIMQPASASGAQRNITRGDAGATPSPTSSSTRNDLVAVLSRGSPGPRRRRRLDRLS